MTMTLSTTHGCLPGCLSLASVVGIGRGGMPERQPLHQAIRVAADPLTVLQRIVQQAMVLLPQADGASLEIRREENVLEYIVGAGTLAPHVGLRLSVHGSFSGLTLLSGQAQICRDALNDPRVDRAAVASTGVRSMLCVPLSDQPASVAVLKVSSGQVGAFSEEDADRLQVLARFLNVTVTAAADLATVTADVLAALDSNEPDANSGVDWQQATAQFVANITTPGLVERVNQQRLVEALLSDEALETVFQPVVDLESGAIVSCEALTRFPASGEQPPDWWFAAAHRAGLGVELELLAIRRVLALLPQLPPQLRVAVNAGPDTIVHPGFQQLLRSADLHRLTVELTEHDVVRDYTRVLAVLQELRRDGVLLSVDDTGSGYSGLTHILHLQPDVIKLDREMVMGVHADPVRRALATAIVSFAEAIGASVIAEGLEVMEEVDCLRQLGVGYVQGFVYWMPMPLAELLAKVS